MNRSVSLTLRCVAGRGVVLALGFGAMTSSVHVLVPVAAAAPTPVLRSLSATEQPPQPAAPRRLFIDEEMTPSPSPSPSPSPTPAPSAPEVVAVATPHPVVISRTVPAAAPSRPTMAAAGGSGAFAFGYCTWWVAHKRPIPWRGNAAEWWWNARAFGFAEGSAPRPGAIMVMGISGSSPQGHVGFVESVSGNSFVVSEMNWWGVPGGGWDRVDYRTVTSMRGILGFIY